MKENRVRYALAAVTVAAGVAAPVPAVAQEAPREGARVEGQGFDPERLIEGRVAMMKERLDLSESQTSRIREILQKEAEQRKAILEKAGIDPDRAPRPDRAGPPGDRGGRMMPGGVGAPAAARRAARRSRGRGDPQGDDGAPGADREGDRGGA